jgi:hypothetical protein
MKCYQIFFYFKTTWDVTIVSDVSSGSQSLQTFIFTNNNVACVCEQRDFPEDRQGLWNTQFLFRGLFAII